MFFPHTPNVSLVAFYGNKPSPLKLFLNQLQEQLANIPVLQNKFFPYSLEQSHCTVIGCEGLATELGIVSKWFYTNRKEIKYIRISDFINYLTQWHIPQNILLETSTKSNLFPLTIRFGGYKINQDYNFLSRNLHPYLRSFQLQVLNKDTIIPVLVGWSIKENHITLDIENFRQQVQKFNLLHKYHHHSESIDNDFYLRLGTIKGQFEPDLLATIEAEIRNSLQTILSTTIVLQPENLAFVQYQDLSLPPETTKVIPLTEITEQKLIELYG